VRERQHPGDLVAALREDHDVRQDGSVDPDRRVTMQLSG
jgi:hypothetical protein